MRKMILKLCMWSCLSITIYQNGYAQFFESKIETAINVDQFRRVGAIAVESSGNIYVVDPVSNVIKKFNNSGTPLLQWGSFGFEDGQFNNPQGISVDATGNVYIVDTGNNRIQRFSSSGIFISKFGSFGTGDGQFNSPNGMTIDGNGNIFVVDTNNHRIQKFSNAGIFVTKWGGLTSSAGGFSSPRGIATDINGNVYVVDTNNFRIQKFTNTGAFVTLWGSGGSSDGQFNGPLSIAVDASGNIFVVESNNHRFQKFNSATTFVSKTGVFGSATGQFNSPRSIALDIIGNIYVSDYGNNRIQKFNNAGSFVLTFGTNAQDNGQLNYPQGTTVDASGNIFVADSDNNRVQKFNSAGAFVSKWGIPGSGDGQFNSPQRMVVDQSGNVYVLDVYNSRIQKFNNAGVFISKFGSMGSGVGQFNTPRGIAIDASGNLYIADTGNHRIQKFNNAGNFITQWGAQGTGDGLFNRPHGIAVDANNDVYVTEHDGHRVQKFSSTGIFILKWGAAGSADGFFWYPQSIAIDGSGSVYVVDASNHRIQIFSKTGTYSGKWGTHGMGDGQFRNPLDISLSDGYCYVADNSNHRVQKFSILGITTSSVPSALPGSTVTITGSGFSAIASENVVKFNGVTASITSATSTSIVTAVPPSATTGSISVTRQGFTVSTPNEFLVLPLSIASFSPGIGVVGNSITISGTGFSSINSNNLVKFNGVSATVTNSTATSIMATLPSGNTVGKITVTVNGITATSTEDFGGALSLTSFTPTNALSDETVTITGSGFSTTLSNQTVKFNGVTAVVMASSLTTLTVKVPVGTTTGRVSVTRDGVTIESANEFVALPLIINSFSPDVSLVGSVVTILGSGFSSVSSNNIVKFNDVTAEVSAGTTATTIVATVPAGATNGKISVTVGDVTTESTSNIKITKLVITQTSYPDFYKVGDPGLNVSVTVNDINEVGSIAFKSRGIATSEESTKTESVPISTLSNSIIYQIPAAHFNDPLGLYSWFSLLDKEGSELVTLPKHTYLNYPSNNSQSEIPNLRFGKNVTDYNLIAVPLNLSETSASKVFKELGEYDKRKWRLYELANGVLKEEPATILPGKGYWFISSTSSEILPGQGSTLKVTKETPYKLALNAGPNLIGNPYDFTISWNDVLDHNGLTPEKLKIKQYINGAVVSDPLLKRFKGAYINSDVARDIEIPIVNRSLSGGRVAPMAKHSLQHEDWVVNLSLDDGDFRNEVFGFGMNRKALEDLDIYDDTELPLLAGMSSFEYSFRSVGSKNLTADIVPTTENYSWESTLNAARDVTLTWDNSYFGDNDKQLVLENASDVHVIDMRSMNQIILREGTHTLKFHYGSIDYIKEKLIEKESRVGYVYPNPVKRTEGAISVALSLPEGKNEVALELRNSLGVSMTSLQSATYDGGRQTIRWQTNMDQLSQGVYLMRVAIKDSNGVSKNSYQRVILE